MYNGLTANQSSKSEIKAHVALVGPLERYKPSVTESALQVDKNNKPGFQLKIWSVAVVSIAVWDAAEDGHMQLGLISRTVVSQLDGSSIPPTGAKLTVSLHAIITQLENMNHVAP